MSPLCLRDDSRRHGFVKAERRTDRQHPIADLSFIRIAKFHERQIATRVDLQYREIGLFVHTDDLCGKFLARIEFYRNPGRIVDDVRIRQNVAAFVDNKTAADRVGRATRQLSIKEIEQITRLRGFRRRGP